MILLYQIILIIKLNIEFPERKTIHGKLIENLRYGENPHQQGLVYTALKDDLGSSETSR